MYINIFTPKGQDIYSVDPCEVCKNEDWTQ